MLDLPVAAVRLPEAVQAQLKASGVAHPVTAVLLNFPAYDTLGDFFQRTYHLACLFGARRSTGRLCGGVGRVAGPGHPAGRCADLARAGGGAAPRSHAASLAIGKPVYSCARGDLSNASPGGSAAHLADGGRLVVACAHRHGGGVAGGVIRSLRIAAGAGACA